MLSWIAVAPGSPYFVTDDGRPWTPIGQNDAVTWPELEGLFRGKNCGPAEAYLRMLAAYGVTCLRLMLEYSESRYRYLERPAGTFNPRMVQLWDDLFALCERFGLRVLLTPFDTFWMWRRWRYHPYNRANGGPCSSRGRMLLCPQTRALMRARLEFATRRWGASGALFGWDLWNEIHPAHAGNSAAPFAEFIGDLAGFLRDLELRIHGRSHPMTVSVFGPHMELDPSISESIFRHPSLDFASTHLYEHGTIDDPRNTVDAAVSTGRLVREALVEIRDERPYFDSEHGPIHSYKDRHRTLPEDFDGEYFRHMQWAHFASGGAGGGMRWPNRRPHSLTRGMREAQRALAGFLPLIDWTRFRRRNWNAEVRLSDQHVAVCACGDREQAVVWLLRRDTVGPRGRMRRDAPPACVAVHLPMEPGACRVTAWDTLEGRAVAEFPAELPCFQAPPLAADLALSVRRTLPV